ncbi:uncharacterized protein N7459_004119 [Penicillium hispanicum]|uniref:uncharacterized protein n=1 Tax=Penicillium hispanicum TaxID=1080232 RepID=UPI00253FADFF|nr:uncharacterized protein N7459_004119 [Penicillium hispanicum]KAJ5584319.1 hypothetical protein N7459_004119 [Penicillium hispanicum]
MLPALTQDSPLAAAVGSVIQPKLVEMGWSTDDGQESALIEYIVLMLVNGKTQEQLATELSNDFLGLGEGDTQALEFSRWLFGQVEILNQQINGGGQDESGAGQHGGQDSSQLEGNGQDADMGDAGDSIPTGPKAMRNGRQAGRGRMLNNINRNLDRSGDSALHRVRGQQGNGRIGGHGRDDIKGGRHNMARRGGRHMGGMGMQGSMNGPMMQMSAENQMQLMSMLEEQARMMSQLMPGFVPPAVNPAFQSGQQPGRSLFDRVERQGQRGGGRFNKRAAHQRPQGTDGVEVDMDTEMDGGQSESNPESVCRFNLRCTRKDCPFAHQSPAAPEGTSIDFSDVCSFGAACKNKKCTGRHPSPAVKSAHQAEEMCRFFPHCTNPHCHFKHPSMPLCRNGGDCKTEDCKFTHLQTACKFNPCLNPTCPYKHAEGQRGAFSDKVWTPQGGAHVSERKFVADENAPEELIKPEANDASQSQELTA